MRLLESGEMYLETIYVLQKTRPIVRSIDVCDYMGYSKPSVSRAVNLLKNGGFLTMRNDGALLLTDTGKEVACRIHERHQLLTALLKKLGVRDETAQADACKIEHDISDETFHAIKRFIDDTPGQ